jgi:HTH-type transcriptional regulator, competence development regulator
MSAEERSNSGANPVEGLRRQRGWSRERLAAEADVSLSTIWRIEHGQHPRVEHLIALADALGVSTDAVLGRRAPASDPDRSRPPAARHDRPTTGR